VPEIGRGFCELDSDLTVMRAAAKDIGYAAFFLCVRGVIYQQQRLSWKNERDQAEPGA
jgi:cbb3-type cytochrome oxidase subunit 3